MRHAELLFCKRGLLFAGLVGLCTGILGCNGSLFGKRLSEAECHELLDRYTNKMIDQSTSSIRPAEREERIMQARRLSQLDPAFAECASRVSREAFECAMKSGNADQMERCLM